MLTPAGSRAARGLLNWTLKDLAEAAGVNFTTISRFEGGQSARPATMARILAAFEANGVELVNSPRLDGAVLVSDPVDRGAG